MKVCLIIGFSYGEDSDVNYVAPDRSPLPGIIIDLYQAYSLARNMEPDKIMIITDIVRDQQTSLLVNSMLDSTVDTGVLEFIESIISLGEHHQFVGKHDFIFVIKSILSQADQTFIYYTGHVSDNYLLFPMDGLDVNFKETINPKKFNHPTDTYDNNIISLPDVLESYYRAHKNDPSSDLTKMSLDEYKSIILSSISKKGEVFIVMDCCNSNGLDLPYHLKDGVGRLLRGENHIFIGARIICVSSTMKDEQSIASRDGSIFSRSLFLNMRSKQRSLKILSKLIDDECSSKFSQTTTVHISHPNLKFLWPWIYGNYNLVMSINNFKNIILIERKPQFLLSCEDNNFNEITQIDERDDANENNIHLDICMVVI